MVEQYGHSQFHLSGREQGSRKKSNWMSGDDLEQYKGRPSRGATHTRASKKTKGATTGTLARLRASIQKFRGRFPAITSGAKRHKENK